MGAPEVGQKLDRFRIVRKLGAGGMGVVYEAADSLRNESVALKTIRFLDPDALYRFKREFRALAGLSHPNLVTLYELFAAGEEWFFTMELVAGKPFDAWMRGEIADTSPSSSDVDLTVTRTIDQPRADAPPSSVDRKPEDASAPRLRATSAIEPRLRATMLQLARALVFLHDAGWLHRDVKPSNVLVTEEGRVVVLDFGVITELRARPEDDFAGTPGYMAPEQINAQPPRPASDWYAFGVMLYEALAGCRPFKGSPSTVLAAKISGAAPDDLTLVAPDAPADLVALCNDLLRANPTERPSGREVLRRLGASSSTQPPRRAASSLPAAARPPSLVGRDAPLAVLEAALDRVTATTGQAVIVHGPSAIGKTALIDAFVTRHAEDPDCLVLRGRCYERESVPYKALDTLVDALCRHLHGQPEAEVQRILPDDTSALAAAFPVVRRLQAFAKRPTSAHDLSQAREYKDKLKRRALDALEQLLAKLTAGRRVILVIDDLQWGDLDSAPLLGSLVSPGGPPLLFLGSFRAEHRESSALLGFLFDAANRANEKVLEELALAPLDHTDLEELAFRLIAGSGVPPEFATRIATAAQGSPYFALELARFAAANAAKGATDDVTSLHAVVRARAAKLSPDARKVLDVVAVSGAPFARQVLEEAAGVSGNSRGFVELAAAHFTKAGAIAEDDAVEPLHDAVREAIANALSPDERRGVHHALWRALEAAGGKWAEPHRLAHHAFHAWPNAPADRVFELCRTAAVAALESYAFDQAYVHLDRAYTVARAAGLEIDFAFEQLFADVASHSGHVDGAVASLRRALTIAPDAIRRAELHLGLARISMGQLDIDASEKECARGLEELGQPGIGRSLAAILLSLGAWLSGLWISRVQRSRFGSLTGDARARSRTAVAIFSHATKTAYFQMDRLTQLQVPMRVSPIAMRLGDSPELAELLAWGSVIFAILKRPRLALRLGSEAQRVADKVGEPLAIARIMQYRAHALHMLGRPLEAEALMLQCLEGPGQWLENLDFFTAVADMGWNSMMRGKPNDGWHWIQAGLERAAVDGIKSRAAEGHTYRCYAGPLLAMLGRATEGARHLDVYDDFLKERGEHRWRRGQWLAHRVFFLVLRGEPSDELEERVEAFRALRFSPRRLPLQIRHFYVAQAMLRVRQLIDATPDTRVAAQRRWHEAERDLARAADHPTLRAHLCAAQAKVAVHESAFVDATKRLDEAAQIADETSNAWIASEVRDLRVEVERRRGAG
jgi:serine/threonine protein kinase/tetratricopeptide (TPR) repeat protein